MSNYKSHSIKLYADNDLHYLNLRDGKDTVTGFGANQPIHELRYTDVASGLENQPIMVRGLHVDVGGATTGVGFKLGDLQSQVTAEVSARESAVSGLQSSLDAEVTRATGAEGILTSDLAALSSDLSDLSALVESNNTSNSTAVSDEASARALADDALIVRIAYLENVISELLNMSL